MAELLSIELVKTFVESTEDFPVDFDDAWRWIGYSRKDTAKELLLSKFESGFDYIIFAPEQTGAKKRGRGGHNRDTIFLGVDCFKSFCMMVGTAKGRDVRQYFLKCEHSLKQLLQQSDAVSLTQDTFSLQKEMSEVVESHIKASQSLNRAIHTAIHQQTDTLRSAFEKIRVLHQKTLTLPIPQNLKESTNLMQLTPRLTSREKRLAVNIFLDLLDDLPALDERRCWSSRRIGEYLGVSYRTILYIKDERSGKREPPKYSD